VSYLVAGVVSGLLMAAVFLVVVPLMLFFLFKGGPPWFLALTKRVPPMTLMMGLLIVAYPTWALVGIVLGLLLLAAETAVPRNGLGSENLLFTLAVTIGAFALVAPYVVLTRRIAPGPAVLTLTFILVFGWVLPFLA
jgi:hypothetical protein